MIIEHVVMRQPEDSQESFIAWKVETEADLAFLPVVFDCGDDARAYGIDIGSVIIRDPPAGRTGLVLTPDQYEALYQRVAEGRIP